MHNAFTFAALCSTAVVGFAASAHAAVNISTDPTQNMSCSGGVCTATAQKAYLNVNDVTNFLAAGDLKVVTAAGAQDIHIQAPFSWTSTSRLTLDAQRSIEFEQPVTVAGTGALTLITNDGGTGGDYGFVGKGHVEYSDVGSNLIINGQTYRLTNSLHQLRDLVKENHYGLFALMKDYREKRVFKKSPIRVLRGVFEKLGNSITGLNVSDRFNDDCVGMFAYADNSATIRDVSLKDVDISTSGGNFGVGPLVGCNYGLVVSASADGIVRGGSGYCECGGLVGENSGNVKRSRSAAAVSSNDLSAGLVGENYGTIDQSYATGSVSGTSAGGLVGFLGVVANSYATGSVTAAGWYGGGLAAGTGRVSSAYATGGVAGTGTLGGFVGSENYQDELSADYWDLDTSGISDPAHGCGNIENCPGVTGLTDTQLKSALPDGFDPNVWGLNPKINNGYP